MQYWIQLGKLPPFITLDCTDTPKIGPVEEGFFFILS